VLNFRIDKFKNIKKKQKIYIYIHKTQSLIQSYLIYVIIAGLFRYNHEYKVHMVTYHIECLTVMEYLWSFSTNTQIGKVKLTETDGYDARKKFFYLIF